MEKCEIVIKNWNMLIEKQLVALEQQLNDLEVSALSACMGDCCQSFHEVYFDLLDKIKNAEPNDYDLIHDCVVDIYWHFNHIKNHIVDAEKGFTVLMNLLAEKAESRSSP